MSDKIVIVAGMGEVGKPLFGVLSRTHQCIGIDIDPVHIDRPCSILHVCYPFQIRDFVGATAAYVNQYRPELTVINSTVAIGTSRAVQERVPNTQVVYSPVRGKHVKMSSDMLKYHKFMAGFNPDATQQAMAHFAAAGFQVSAFRSPDLGELSKLVETTWLGILIGWAQDVERMASDCGASYEDVNAFIREIDFLPTNVFPGHIGGHCVMPNIAILKKKFGSKFLDAVVESNEMKEQMVKAIPPRYEAEVGPTMADWEKFAYSLRANNERPSAKLPKTTTEQAPTTTVTQPGN